MSMRSLETLLKYVVFAGIFVIPFLVFLVDSSQVFPFITGKNFSFRVIVGILFFAWLALAFLREEYRPKTSPLLAAVALFVGVMFIANIFGIEPKQSFWSNFERMEGWVSLVHFLAYVLVLSSVLTSKDLWRKFWNTTVIASVGVGLFAMAQLLREYLVEVLGRPANEGLAQLLPIVNQGGDRLDATFGNATYLAVYMLLHIFITITLLLRYKSLTRNWKIFYTAALGLQLISLYFTATRGAILGLIGGLIVTTVLLLIFEKRGTKVWRFSVGVIVTIVVLVGLFFALKDTTFVREQNTLNRLASISLEDNTTKSRFIMWDLAWKGVQERPILGYGQGNFNYVFNTHYNPELYNQEQWFDRAHNVVFDWLIAGGFVGFIAYVLIYVALIRMIIFNDQLSKREKIVFIGMLSAYIFQNLFVFDQLGSYMLFFAIIAYIHSLGAKKDLFPNLFEIQAETRDRIVVPILVTCLFVVPYLVNADGYFQSKTGIRALNVGAATSVSELQLRIAESRDNFQKAIEYNSLGTAEIRERLPQLTLQILQSPQLEDSLKQDFVNLTRQQLETQLSETPLDARYYIIYGGFLAQIGFLEEAIGHLERAIELTPNKQIVYQETARVYGASGNLEKMFETTQKGYEIYTENDSAWSTYALAAGAVGEIELYMSLIEQAFAEERYEALEGVLLVQLQSNPEAQELKELLAEVYQRTGQTAKLGELLES